MKLKILDLNEKQLKDYLVASVRIKELAGDKLNLVLNSYKKAADSDKEEMKRILIESHLKMVISLANRYRGAGISFTGLIQLGNAGLIKAVKEWDCAENDSFAPWLVWHIEGAILDALISLKKEAREI